MIVFLQLGRQESHSSDFFNKYVTHEHTRMNCVNNSLSFYQHFCRFFSMYFLTVYLFLVFRCECKNTQTC